VPKRELKKPRLLSDQTKLGHLLRATRESLGLSIRNLSVLCCVSSSQLARIESGRSDCTLSRFVSISGSLGLVPGDVIESMQYLDFEPTFHSIEIRNFVSDDEVLGEKIARWCWRMAIILIFSANPEGRISSMPFPLDDMQRNFRAFAVVAQGFSPAERRSTAEAFCERPIAKLWALKLLPGSKERPKLQSSKFDWMFVNPMPESVLESWSAILDSKKVK